MVMQKSEASRAIFYLCMSKVWPMSKYFTFVTCSLIGWDLGSHRQENRLLMKKARDALYYQDKTWIFDTLQDLYYRSATFLLLSERAAETAEQGQECSTYGRRKTTCWRKAINYVNNAAWNKKNDRTWLPPCLWKNKYHVWRGVILTHWALADLGKILEK